MLITNIKQLGEYCLNTNIHPIKQLLDILSNHNIKLHINNNIMAYGLAIPDNIYVNIIKMQNDVDLLIFTICHELSHVLDINKFGFQTMLVELSEPNFDKFSRDIIHKEIISDRFGSIMFYKLTGRLYPINKTQNLTKKVNKDKYLTMLKHYFKQHDGTKETYYKLVNLYLNN